MIPVRIAECNPTHDRLREIQWLDLFPDWETGIQRLAKVFSFSQAEIKGATENLSGTQWVCTETHKSLGDWTFLLRSDGVVEYAHNNAKQDNGKWYQEGSTIFMEFNGKFAQYRGTILGKSMAGVAQNINGDEWTWEARQANSA